MIDSRHMLWHRANLPIKGWCVRTVLSLQKRCLALDMAAILRSYYTSKIFKSFGRTRLHWREAACKLSLTTSSFRPARQQPPSFLPPRVILQVPLLHITRGELKLVPNLLPSVPQIDDVVDIDLVLDHLLNPRQPRPTLPRLLPKLPVSLGRQTE